ncbi:MAG TPA: FHA domain-containing protein [Pyrinomonadaceae bacterium]|jgi:DNA-directed RNA polymerase specialized sigma24 family protein
MLITYSFGGAERTAELDVERVVVGRHKAGAGVDLDLSPDAKVSRPHAKLWEERRPWTGSRQYFIEDLGSTHGTLLNGEEIKGRGARGLRPGDVIQVGETTLLVHVPEPPALSALAASLTNEQLMYAWLELFLLKSRSDGTAEAKLEDVRRRLLRFSEARGLRHAEDWVQETLLRVALNVRKVAERWNEEDDPAKYFNAVWANVRKEAAREAARAKVPPALTYEVEISTDAEYREEAGRECREKCVGELPPGDLSLVVRYVSRGKGRESAEEIAGEFGVTVNALRQRVNRIRRERLDPCVDKCLDEAGARRDAP